MTFEPWVAPMREVFQYQLFMVNQTPITISSMFIFLLTLTLFYFLSKIAKAVLEHNFLSHLQISSGTHYTLIRLSQYTLWFLGGLIAFQFIGVDLSGLAVILGFLSVGIGFGMQNLTSNFISGLILLFEQHIQVGDRVTVGQTEGDVEEINIRSTTIRSLNNVAIIVPNSEFISGTVTNWSHGDPKTRLEIDVGVSYESDLDTVIRSLLEVAQQHSLVLSTPEPGVWLLGFGDSSWNMRLLAWVNSPKIRAKVGSELNCAIVHKFRENRVEIPFPQRDLHLRSAPAPLQVSTQV